MAGHSDLAACGVPGRNSISGMLRREERGQRLGSCQVQVIGHEYPGVDCYAVLPRVLFQPMRIGRKVFLTAEADLPIVTPLDDVLRNPW